MNCYKKEKVFGYFFFSTNSKIIINILLLFQNIFDDIFRKRQDLDSRCQILYQIY